MEPTTVIAAAGLALKLKELTPLLTALRNSAPRDVRDQIDAVSDKFFEIRTDLVEAGEREAALREQCRALEGELQRMKDWEAEKARYALTKIADTFFVYLLKPECAEGDPPHWLCAKCFADRKSSILQGLPDRVWKCLNCGNTFHEPNRPRMGARVV